MCLLPHVVCVYRYARHSPIVDDAVFECLRAHVPHFDCGVGV